MRKKNKETDAKEVDAKVGRRSKESKEEKGSMGKRCGLFIRPGSGTPVHSRTLRKEKKL